MIPNALGALGRGLKSCRPEHLKPSHRKFASLSFLLFIFCPQ